MEKALIEYAAWYVDNKIDNLTLDDLVEDYSWDDDGNGGCLDRHSLNNLLREAFLAGYHHGK